MGRGVAADMAAAVQGGDWLLESVLQYHLTANMHPPLPTFYVKPLMTALRNVAHDEGQEYVTFSVPGNGLVPVPTTAVLDKDYDLYEIRSDDLVQAMRAETYLSLM